MVWHTVNWSKSLKLVPPFYLLNQESVLNRKSIVRRIVGFQKNPLLLMANISDNVVMHAL